MEQMNNVANETTLLRNMMQIQLADLCGESIDEFIERHAERFHDLIQANPDLLDEYKRTPDSILAKVKEKILH
jgi:hypothetical protein